MEIDQSKFLNLVMEKTTQKLNTLQSQVIVLESQLAVMTEEYSQLKQQLEEAKPSGKSKQQTGTY